MSLRLDNVLLWQDEALSESPQSLLIRDGRIEALGRAAQSAEAETVIDGEGGWLLPGLLDLNARLGDGGGSLERETRAAARGGYTAVCATPDATPVNDSGAVTHLIRDLAAQHAHVRVLPLGALTRGLEGDRLSDMAALQAAGCVALTQGEARIRDARVLRRCMAYARTFDIPVFVQPENAALAADGCVHDGPVASTMGLPGIPEVAETAAVSECLLLAEETGVRLHLGQLSCARSVALVREARQRGLPVTADVTMHHLCFTEERIVGYDGRYHTRPPLRSEQDRQALLAGLEDGAIDSISSQHRPRDHAAKNAPFADTEPGLATLETCLAQGLGLVSAGELSLKALIRALTTGPAKVLGQSSQGLTNQSVADLCLVQPSAAWEVRSASLVTAGINAPAEGETLTGQVVLTLVAGEVAYRRS